MTGHPFESSLKDFPARSITQKGKDPVYLDNACASLRPLQVVKAMNTYYLEHPSCHKRAVHSFGKRTSDKYDSARESVRDFINAKNAEEILFTRNSTEGINLIASSFSFNEGDSVLTTDLEHNSNFIPWRVLQSKKGIRHITLPIGPDGAFSLDALRTTLAQNKGIKLVSVFSHSHVLGTASPIDEIVRISHEAGAKVLIDAAQTALHEPIDVSHSNADFLVLSFHKMLGPSGMGMLYGKGELLRALPQFLTGGETVEDVDDCRFVPSDIPYRFEAGLQNYAGAMGAEAAIRYIEDLGDKRRDWEVYLNEIITNELIGHDRFHLLGPAPADARGSILNFYIEGIDSGELSILLDQSENIMTRSGVHCCHAWYRKYDVTPSLRASFAFYNTEREAEVFIRTIKNILQFY